MLINNTLVEEIDEVLGNNLLPNKFSPLYVKTFIDSIVDKLNVYSCPLFKNQDKFMAKYQNE
jgi:hypothetical protein